MQNKLSIKIIAGSTREGRFSDKAANWIAGELKKRDGVVAEVLDLRDYPMPFFDSPMTPSSKKEPYSNKEVARFTKKIAEGDAFIFVTPEYNHSIPAVLKNAIDWVYQEWGDKPAAFISYGTVGGARAVEHLRQIVVELHMASVRDAVHFAAEDYFPTLMGKAKIEDMFIKYQPKAEIMINGLLKWANIFKTGNSK